MNSQAKLWLAQLLSRLGNEILKQYPGDGLLMIHIHDDQIISAVCGAIQPSAVAHALRSYADTVEERWIDKPTSGAN